MSLQIKARQPPILAFFDLMSRRFRCLGDLSATPTQEGPSGALHGSLHASSRLCPEIGIGCSSANDLAERSRPPRERLRIVNSVLLATALTCRAQLPPPRQQKEHAEFRSTRRIARCLRSERQNHYVLVRDAGMLRAARAASFPLQGVLRLLQGFASAFV